MNVSTRFIERDEVSLDVDAAPRSATAPIRRAGRMVRTAVTASATPDKLRRVGAVLVVGCLFAAVVSFVSGIARTDAVADGSTRVGALTADAAQLYRSLADADAMATSGYVSGGLEPAAVRARYDDDLARAADRLVHAAGQLTDGDLAAAPVATISAQLPVYSGLIATARAYNRQGLPLGQSYLGSGSRLMRDTILPAADELRRLQTAALADSSRRGGGIPFAVLLTGLAVLAALVDVAVLERRRTNRVLSTGLLAAGVAIVAALLWWVVATAVAGQRLDGAAGHGAAATALDDARAAVLQARSNESLVLVARGGGGSSEQGFAAQLDRVLGTGGNAGLLAAAAAADPAAAARVDAIRSAALAWQEAHRRVRELDDGGRYADAVASAVGADPAGSGATFDRLDAALGDAAVAEREAFASDAGGARTALTGLSGGPAILGLIAAVAVTVGIGRRVGEYR